MMKIHDCSADGETGYAATCAEFPEANGQGETREDCLASRGDRLQLFSRDDGAAGLLAAVGQNLLDGSTQVSQTVLTSFALAVGLGKLRTGGCITGFAIGRTVVDLHR